MNMKQTLVQGARKVKRKNAPIEARARKIKPNPRTLLSWYDANRRILPWRALPGMAIDPYRVWLSEIMLQQTTVAAVGPYFQKFVKRWPTLRHLASASIEEVRQMWAGLGYYRRAQLLHDCARRICADYGGELPRTEGELSELPGCGPYTAAAVAAIAFDERANVVDGNVERVMARMFAIDTPLPKAKAEIRTRAATLLPRSRHGDYAQALMDLGATICTPRNPKCGLCPWAKACRARALGLAEKLPSRIYSRPKPVRRAIAFFLTNPKGEVFLRQRPKRGLLAGMMEIPSSAWLGGPMPQLGAAKEEAPVVTAWTLLPGTVKHVFSHFELEIAVAAGAATAAAARRAASGGRWVKPAQLGRQALPSVMRKIARHALGLLE